MIITFIFLLGIALCITGYYEWQLINMEKKQKIQYKFVEKTIEEEQMLN